MTPRDQGVVRAAGGVVWRTADPGPEVLLVHRPKYGDWSLPKGKRDPGETDEQCAVREVEEEAGLRCRLGRELLPCAYTDSRGRPKVVRYWEMTIVSGGFTPTDEIDEVQWVPIDAVRAVLSYPRDAAVVESFAVTRS